MPRMREGRLVPGIVKMEMIPNTNAIITKVLGISMVAISMIVIIVISNINPDTVIVVYQSS